MWWLMLLRRSWIGRMRGVVGRFARAEPRARMWEAPVVRNRRSVGLDVHARSMVACGWDGQTGELFERRLTLPYGSR